ncbi:MAG: 50S ribosomal protein L2 [Opitutales bacterium]|nr:50S ribosomal protein L2 [Opitutales bacterium]MCH8539894.1 50S ribosomal protein L2 [Opitutales bacterium]
MALKEYRPITPTQRFLVLNPQEKLEKKKPERRLTKSKKRSSGRNAYGRITSRRRGGGHKRNLRLVDFRRDKLDIPAKIQGLEYDPNRSANLALLAYADGEKRYILAPRGLGEGDTVVTSETCDFNPGNATSLGRIPPSTKIHAIEMLPGKGAQMVRTAGAAATLVSVDGEKATIKLPSGEIRMVNSRCRATIGEVGNAEHSNIILGKAGRNRWKGRRPRVRGVAMNPVDHPMGGGEGRTSGGGHPVSPWGQLAKGFPTRRRSKTSNSQILVRRNGRKVKSK